MPETYRQRIKRTQREALRQRKRPRHWISEQDVSQFLVFSGDEFNARVVLPLEASVLAKSKMGQVAQPLELPPQVPGWCVKRAEILPSNVRLIVAERYILERDETVVVARADAIFAHV